MLQSPLSVLVGSATDRHHIQVSDLEFFKTDMGGYQSATFTLPAWLNSADPALGPVARVMVDDARTARRAWEGYLDLPGKTVSRDGQTWQIGAVGSRSVLSDRQKSFIGIDQNLDGWVLKVNKPRAATGASGAHPLNEDLQTLLMQYPDGTKVVNTDRIKMYYEQIADAGQIIGAFGYVVDSGILSVNYREQADVYVAGWVTVHDYAASTVAAYRSAIPPAWTGNATRMRFAWNANAGAVTIPNDDYWAAFYDLWVKAQHKSKAGTAYSSTDGWVLAQDVVVSALWHFTNRIDIANAVIGTGFAQHIDQLAYPDGTRFPDLMSDLLLFEPDLTYGVFESNDAGLHRFTCGKYPTTARYEIDTRDGWSEPGGEANLSNSLRVFWQDKKGVAKSSVYTTPVPALDQWGRIRDAEPVELAGELGSQANADRVGPAVLAVESVPNVSGTATVARPIRDFVTGAMVMPWEIEPGNLVSIRDRDGPPLRLTEMSYRDSDQAATLTLGTPTYTTEQLVSALASERARRGGKRVRKHRRHRR